MFALQIHSVDFPQPLPTATTSAVRVSDASDSIAKLNPAEQRGVAHLFRHLPPSTSATYASALTGIANPIARTTTLFVVAVPNYLSPDDFLLFCASHVEHFTGILFLRNDVMEDRYSVLITLVSQLAADGFYCSYNGKRFKPTEGEVCHIYFTQSVECAESAEIASIPPPGYTELPTCPVCLERLDQDTSGIQSTLCDHSFHCSCVSKWTYSSCQVCRPCQQQDERSTRSVCEAPKNLWVCLICDLIKVEEKVGGKLEVTEAENYVQCFNASESMKRIHTASVAQLLITWMLLLAERRINEALSNLDEGEHIASWCNSKLVFSLPHLSF